MQARAIRVRGQVQGVGFRPFIWQLAREMGVTGEVLNDPEGVLIRAFGEDLDAFAAAIPARAPPLARVDAVEAGRHRFDAPPTAFVIALSEGAGAQTRVTPDAASCAACIADLRGDDPRRAGYAFTNCTHCGPRFTILKGLPYDRARTSMAAFAMCAECAAEYADPADRRFHAQPVACAVCGPQLWLETPEGARNRDPLAEAATLLRAGKLLAIKGLGGFHIACDALNAEAIATLRARKRRPAKPLAIMARAEDAARYAEVCEAALARLSEPAAPILLLPMRDDALPDALAPGLAEIGIMLPYTPLHHALLAAMRGPLVMTSGNLSGEPQVIGNDEAREKLGDLVDGSLLHNRDIARRLDDSVERITAQGPMVLRRARGQVPGTLPLPEGFEQAPQVVAFGAHLKSAICLTKNAQALLSHHLGDLDDALTWDEFTRADADYAALFEHRPEVFACDLHPDYRSSRHALARADGGTLIEVQHHHAHLAACLAENRWPLSGGPVAGIVLDGLGLGADGTVWGGELLLGDYNGFTRQSWLRPAPLIGGDRASVEPWRNLLARLDRAGLGALADARLGGKPLALLRQAAQTGLNAPLSSSAGRLFDAVAALLDLTPDRQSFEGQAAMALEAAARRAPREPVTNAYPMGLDAPEGEIPDSDLWHRMAQDLAQGVPPERIAWRFHAGLAGAFAGRARALVTSGVAEAVALSGGCFQNALLQDLTVEALGDVPVLLHRQVPANDGGLALGQAVIAAATVLAER